MTINDINIGDTIWYSHFGDVGQFRILEIDKDNNLLKYKTSDNTTHEIKYNNTDFYLDPSIAFDNARRYNNLHVKDIKQGMFGTEVVYKTPDEVNDTLVTQMLLD